MNNYLAYEAGYFKVTSEEIKKLQKIPLIKDNKEDVIHNIKMRNGYVVTDYESYEIPKNLKRSKYDNATLLVIYLVSGEMYAKRFNNNQTINVR